MELINVLCTTVVLLSAVFQTGAALSCYQCDSTLDPNCQEKWDDSLKVNQEKYVGCQVWDAKYCTKVTGMWGGVVGTHRFCSAKDLGDQCQDIWFPDHNRMYRACVYSCDSDGCNGAQGLSHHSVSTVVSVICAVWAVVRFL